MKEETIPNFVKHPGFSGWKTIQAKKRSARIEKMAEYTLLGIALIVWLGFIIALG